MLFSATVQGVVFEDLNGNGILDASNNEVGLDNWTVTADRTDGFNFPSSHSTQTASDGTYSLLLNDIPIDADIYPTRPTPPAGPAWEWTLPSSGVISAVDLGDNTYGGFDFGVVQGSVTYSVSEASDVVNGDYSIGNLSLREAIALSEQHAGQDIITFDTSLLGASSIILDPNLGELVVTGDLIIQGPGADALTIDANGVSSVFKADATGGNEGVLAIRGLTLTGASTYGVENFNGDLTIEQSVLTGNQGIYAISSSCGDLKITDTAIVDNQAVGISVYYGDLNASNVTISGNESVQSYIAAVNVTFGSAVLRNVTVTDNHARSDTANPAGNLHAVYANANGNITLYNSIVADNYGGLAQDAIADLGRYQSNYYNGTISSNSANNLIGDGGNSGLIDGGTQNNIVGDSLNPIDPLLAPLGINGGSTPTHELLFGSPAVNTGDNSQALAVDGLTYLLTDQRGEVRPQQGTVDIGAVESAFPTELTVSTSSDVVDGDYGAGKLSLREAIALSEQHAGQDIITFDTVSLGSNSIVFDPNLGELVVTGDLIIQGPGADRLTIDGNGVDSIFKADATGSNEGDLTIRGLTLTGASANGVINYNGFLTIEQSVLTGNQGVNTISSTFGNLEITDTAIVDNQAVGISMYYGSLKASNVTVSGNKSTQFDAAAVNVAFGSAVLRNVTVTDNHARSNTADPGDLYAVYANAAGTVTLYNSIVADNYGGLAQDAIADLGRSQSGYYTGSINSNSANNLIGDGGNSGLVDGGAQNNIVGDSTSPKDPLLAPLANNGGSTPTHSLLPGSPAIDKGDGSQALAPDGVTSLDMDQRGQGFTRTLGEQVDIGSYEARTNILLVGQGSVDAGAIYELKIYLNGAYENLSGDLTNITVDWGDGSSDLGPISFIDGVASLDNTYSTGLETVSIRVTIDDNGLITQSPVLEVNVTEGFRFVEKGGSATGKAVATLTSSSIDITEGDSFSATLSRIVSLDPENEPNLVVRFSYLVFPDADDTTINDAFELALLDGDGNSLVTTIGPGRDAFFNISEDVNGQGTLRAPGVSYLPAEGLVSVDVSALAAGEATLVYRLINDDGDTTSSVSISTINSFFSLWGVEEIGGELFRYSGDFRSSILNSGAVGFEKFGIVRLPDGSEIGRELEALAIDPSGLAYMVVNQGITIDSVSIDRPVLLRLDLNEVLAGGDAVNAGDPQIDRYGRIAFAAPGQNNNQDAVTGITIDPVSGDLYALFKTNGDADVDKLLRLEVSADAGSVNGLVINEIELGDLVGVTSGEALTFDLDGTLLVTNTLNVGGAGENAQVYGVTLTEDRSGIASTTLINGDVKDSLTADGVGRVKLEGIAIDPRNGDIIATNTSGNLSQIIRIGSDPLSPSASLERELGLDFGVGSESSDVEALGFVTLAVAPGGNIPGEPTGATPASVSFEGLSDVTELFTLDYGSTTFNELNDNLFAQLVPTLNTSDLLRGPLLLGVTNISDPTVSVLSTDGQTDEGVEFYNVSSLATLDPSGRFYQAGPVGPLNLQFLNPAGNPFTYDVVLLSRLNSAPEFTEDPGFTDSAGRVIEVVAGTPFEFDAAAFDLDGDDLTFSIVNRPDALGFKDSIAGPTDGIISWTPGVGDVGNSFPVTLRVSDNFGGVDELSFTIKVIDLPNRPPMFEQPPNPITEAFVNVVGAPVELDPASWDIVQIEPGVGSPEPWTFGDFGNGRGALSSNVVGFDPAVILSPEVYGATHFSGRIAGIMNDSTGEATSVGLVFGYQNGGQFYLLDWQGAGSTTPGFSIKRVDSPGPVSVADLTAVGGNGTTVVELFRSNAVWDNSGGVDFFDVDLIYLQDEFLLSIRDASSGDLVESVSIQDDRFGSGRFGVFAETFALFDGFSAQSLSDRPYIYDSLATDNDSDELRYSLDNAPAGMFIDQRTGRVIWNAGPELLDQPDPDVTIRVVDLDAVGSPIDAANSFDVQPFKIRVFENPANNDPIITKVPDEPAFAGQDYSDYVFAVDPDEDELSFEILAGAIGDMAIDNNGLLTWTVPVGESGNKTITVRVEDGRGGEDVEDFDIIVNPAFAEIRGRKWEDINGNGLRDLVPVVEPYLAGVDVYLDLNNNAVLDLDQGEPVQRTQFDNPLTPDFDETGLYRFTGLAADTYIVREIVPDGFRQTFPGNFVPGSSVIQINEDDFVEGATSSITFSEFPLDTIITDQYSSLGIGVTFGGFFGGQRLANQGELPFGQSVTGTVLDAPSSPLALDSESPAPFIVDDSFNDTSPVLSGGIGNPTNINQPFDGPVAFLFEDPLVSFGIDGGFFDDLNSTAITAYDENGQVLGQVQNSVTGIEFLGFASADGVTPLIKGVLFSIVGNEGNGFAVDNLRFGVQPLPQLSGAHEVTVALGEIAENYDFGNQRIEDNAGNQAPVFDSVPLEEVTVGELYDYAVLASDPDLDPFVVDAPIKPAGMVFDPVTRRLIWNPTRNDVGTYNVVLRVKDDTNGITLQGYQVTVNPINEAPLFVTKSLGDAQADTAYEFPIFADDPDGPSVTFTDLTVTQRPAGSVDSFTIHPITGLITGQADTVGDYTLQVTIQDDQGKATVKDYTLTVTEPQPNRAPVIENRPRNQIAVGQTLTYRVNVTDEDQDPLAINISFPAGADFDPETRTLTWSPTAADVLPPGQTYTITVRADDGRGEANSVVEESFPVQVTGVAFNDPPEILQKLYDVAVVDRPYSIQFEATDPNDDGFTWVLVERSDPRLVLNELTGEFGWTPDESNLLTPARVVVKAVDDLGAESGTLELVIPVRGRNGAPSLVDFNPPRATEVGTASYAYQVQAQDIDGGPQPLSYALFDDLGNALPDTAGVDWLQIDSNGLISVVPGKTAPVNPETVSLELRISDGEFVVSQPFTISVTDDLSLVNLPPNLKPAPIYNAFEGQTDWTYTAEFEDPEMDAVTVTLNQSLTTATGVTLSGDDVVWDTTGLVADQTYNIVLDATDAMGSGLTTRVTLPVFLSSAVANNQPPVFVPPTIADQTISVGERFEVRAYADDPDATNIRLTYELVNQDTLPAGISIDVNGLITWDVPQDFLESSFGASQDVIVDVQVRDDFGVSAVAAQQFTLTIEQDTQAPVVTVDASERVVPIGTQVQFFVTATDNVGISTVELRLLNSATGKEDLVTLSQDPSRPTLYLGVATLDVPGAYEAIASAVDVIQIASSPTEALLVTSYDPATVVLPGAILKMVDDGDVLTAARDITFDVSANGGDASAVTYTLELVDSTNNRIVLSTGIGEVTDEPGTIPVSTVPNGEYSIVLTADNDLLQPVSDFRSITIDSGSVKIGGFDITFTDVTIPVGGFPLVISRNYDTSRINFDDPDFGPGWSLAFRHSQLSTTNTLPPREFNGDLGITKTGNFDAFIRREESLTGTGTLVFFTLPDGTRESFEYTAAERPQAFGFGDSFFTPSFISRPGTTSRLTLTSNRDLILRDGFLVDPNNLTRYSPANLNQDYILTTQGGTEYRINSRTGEFIDITDNQKNTVAFDRDGAVTKNKDGDTVAELVFVRNGPNGQISEIVDPNGDRFTYLYDTDGRLSGTIDRTGRETVYGYGEDVDTFDIPDGYFTSASLKTDNNDLIRALQAEFEADPNISGVIRFVGLTDALGAGADFSYELDGEPLTGVVGSSIETVKDDNDVPIELVRDAKGNTLRRIAQLDSTSQRYQISAFTYDSDNNQTGQTKPFVIDESVLGMNTRYTALPDGVTALVDDPDDPGFDASLWGVVTGYDSRGNVTLQIDGEGNRTLFQNYDRFGIPGTIIDPSGTVSKNKVTQGLIEETSVTGLNGDGQVVVLSKTTYGYDGNGNLKRLTQFDGDRKVVLSDLSYDSAGRLIESTGNTGLISYLRYDDNGNQTISFSLNQGKLQVSRSVYDGEGRVTASAQYEVASPPADLRGLFNDHDVIDSELTGLGAVMLFGAATTYDFAGRVQSSTDRFGRVSTNRYDVRGNLVETRTPVMLSNQTGGTLVTRTAYDTNGRAIATSDPFLLNGNEDYVNPADETMVVSKDGPPPAFLRLTHTLYDDLGRAVETRRVSGARIDVSETVELTGVYESEFDPAIDYSRDQIISASLTVYDDAGRVDSTTQLADTDGSGSFGSSADPGDTLTNPATVAADFAVDEYVTSRFDYDDAGRQKSSTVEVDLNQNGGIDASTEWIETASTFDVGGRQDTITDPLGRITRFSYDGLGRVTSTTIDDDNFLTANPTVKTEYDALGRRVAEIDALDRRTDFEYDDAGRLVAVTLPPINPAEGDSRRPRYEYHYDAFGNQSAIVNNIFVEADGITVIYYTKDANNTDQEIFRRNITQALIDPADLIHVTTFTYDPFNRQTTRTLPLDQIERQFYDDTPIATVQNAGGTAASVAGGQLAFLVDFEGRVTEYVYDNTSTGGGRLVQKLYYGVVSLSSAPSLADVRAAVSGLTATEDVAYAYDGLGRQTSIDDSADGVTKQRYDADGRLILIDRTNATEGTALNYEYDSLGRRIRSYSTETVGGTPVTDTTYAYDALGRITRVDAERRGGVELNGPAEETTQYFYDALGRIDFQRLANGLTTDYQFDGLGRLSDLIHFTDTSGDGKADPGEDRVAEFGYQYDLAGNRTSATERFDTDGDGDIDAADEPAQSFNWKYDGLNRLIEELFDRDGNGVADYTDTFAFDIASNRVTYQRTSIDGTFAAFTTGYTYDANDRLRTEVKDAGSDGNTGTTDDRTTTYAYGPGNAGTEQTGKTVVDGTGASVATTTFEFNVRGRQSQIEQDTDGDDILDVRTTYTYSDAGLRVEEAVTTNPDQPGASTTTTTYTFDPANPTGYAQALEERISVDAATAVLGRAYTLGLDVLSQTINLDSTPESHQFLYDAHGSTRALAGTNGSIVNAGQAQAQVFTYDAYGQSIAGTGNSGAAPTALTALLYSGEWTSSVTSQQYLRARYYDPSSGRFNRVDPYFGNQNSPLSYHKYSYTHGNPILGSDPSGLFSTTNVLATVSITTVLGGLLGGALAPAGERAEFAIVGAVSGLQLGVGLSVGIITQRIGAVLVDGLISLGIELVASSLEQGFGSPPEPGKSEFTGFPRVAFNSFAAFSNGVFDSSIAPKITGSALSAFTSLGVGANIFFRNTIAEVANNRGKPLDENKAIQTLLATSIEAGFTFALANPNLLTRRAGARLGRLLNSPALRDLILDSSGRVQAELGQDIASGVSKFIAPAISTAFSRLGPLALEALGSND